MAIRLPNLPESPTSGRPQRRRYTAFFASAAAFLITLIITGALVFVLQPFGNRGWPFAIIFGLLGAVSASLHRAIRKQPATSSAPRSIMERPLLIGAATGAGALSSWLALIAYSAIAPGGVAPPLKRDPTAIRVLT